MVTMTRSKLAKECGVNIESLRYYEKRRLDAARIRFIQNAKKLGFTLNEILELLKLRVKKNESCESVLAKTQTKLDEVDQKIKGLKSMKKVLKQMIHQCQEATLTGDCPILCSFESGREL